jgi:hypothetical protein
MVWQIPPLSSGGLILSYQCSNQCQHCLYASSPSWRDWISEADAGRILSSIQKHSQYLTGIHLAGGEPMLKPDLVISVIKKAVELDLPIDYVETNAFWCWNDEKTWSVFQRLKEAGLRAVLVSCSPFHLEFIPMEKVQRAIHVGRKVFGSNGVLIYTSYFYQQLQQLAPKQTLPLEDYIEAVGSERASLAFSTEYGLIPNGRAATRLHHLFQHYDVSHFSGETCKCELSSPHHIHIDLYGNYIAGLCGGITIGDGYNLDQLYCGVDLSTKPVLRRLVEGGVDALYRWAVEEYDFKADPEGYIAKCHLCLDIRRYLIGIHADFEELAPKAYYQNLGSL